MKILSRYPGDRKLAVWLLQVTLFFASIIPVDLAVVRAPNVYSRTPTELTHTYRQLRRFTLFKARVPSVFSPSEGVPALRDHHFYLTSIFNDLVRVSFTSAMNEPWLPGTLSVLVPAIAVYPFGEEKPHSLEA